MATKSSKFNEDIQILCSDKYDPICGSDLITYKNQCYFELTQSQVHNNTLLLVDNISTKNQLKFLYKGECCNSIRECTFDYSPVCDNLNKTHLVKI